MSGAQRLIPTGLALLLFAVAVVLRAVYIMSMQDFTLFENDAARYFSIAFNLHLHGVYSAALPAEIAPVPDALITPGYPLLIYLLFPLAESPRELFYWITGAQACLGGVSVVLVYLLARFVVSPGLACVPAVLTALAPHQIVASGYVLTEVWHGVLVLGGVWVLLLAQRSQRKLLWFLAGMLFAVAVLTRPVFLGYALLLPLLLVLRHPVPARKSAACYLAGLLVLIGVWSGYARSVPAAEDSVLRSVIMLGSYPDFTWQDPAQRGYPNREDPAYQEAVQSWPVLLGTISERVAEQPVRFLQWYLVGKPASLWGWHIVQGVGGPFVYGVPRNAYLEPSLYRRTAQVYYRMHSPLMGIAMVFAVISGIGFLTRRLDSDGALPVFVVATVPLYMTLIHIPLASLPRYVVPYHPIMYLLAFLAVVAGAQRLRAGCFGRAKNPPGGVR